ncbi:MAG: hypothetical protein MI799_24535 [Desulfobacterales bacterium]|nr:hypothetical protein [Desulfobacterales bacterium]
MIGACKQFIIDQLVEVMGDDTPFPFDDTNIFFEPLPRDYLKTHTFAACCLVQTDKKKRAPRLMSSTRSTDCKYFTRVYRKFERQILFRVLLYAPTFEAQYGKAQVDNVWDFDAYAGIVNAFEQRVAGTRVIPDGLNNAVTVELEDSFRPWTRDEASLALKRGPHKSIVRIEFTGGIYVTKQFPILQGVELQPEYQ